MPWKETKPVEQRYDLIRDWQAGENISVLAELYDVSRKTVYKWIERYEQQGIAGLEERSRAPRETPHKLSAELEMAIVEARRRWKWGPRKLRVKLMEAQPGVDWPAPSTIGEVLKRSGLIAAGRQRVRTLRRESPMALIDGCNQTWCADFKGWFRTGDGKRCDPLTITDAHSRYLLRCHIVPKTDGPHAEAIFDAAFHEYGLPVVIRTDNGTPFASLAPGGLSRLSIRWIKLGIVPERTRPASPQDNGRHERMHRTLKHDTLRPAQPTARQQQMAFDRFRKQFNDDRPHEALGDQTPASQYSASPRSMPLRVPEMSYPPDMIVRRISERGSFKWHSQVTQLSAIFALELVGMRPLDERYYQLFYGPVSLGWFDSHRHSFHRKLGLALRRRMGLDSSK